MTSLPLDAVLQALPMPVVAINGSQKIVALNAPAEALIGQGTRDRHFVTALRQPALVQAVETCLRDGRDGHAVFQAGASDAPTTFEVHLHKINGQDTVLLSFRDVSQVEQAGQMRSDFVANVSHELRTPLTSLMGFIETLRGPARKDEAARDRFLNIMAQEAERMNRLIDGLLSLSRLEAQERQRPADKVDLVALLGTTLRNLAPLAADNRITLRPDYDAAQVQVRGDADQLQQVFTNLVENAIKYGGSDQTVDVVLRVMDHAPALRGPAVRISVIDHGPGIDPMHLPRLTERFYRADSHRSRALGGTGLGLAIVKHILNRHRGRIRIASQLGQGADFSILLPLDVVSDQKSVAK